MVNYRCETCFKVFNQKGHFEVHVKRKNPCKKDTLIETLIERKVQEALAKTKMGPDNAEERIEMDYSKKSVSELKQLCKEQNIRGISTKTKAELLALLQPKEAVVVPEIKLHQEVLLGDSMTILPTLESESAQIVIADPPYNIGKDFGNDSDKQPMDQYLLWCEGWIKECLRILKPNGTMFIYGFSEILALILSKVPHDVNRRWVVWHYTNKTVPSLNFWQRSHESIIVLWKSEKVFHRDEVRESYTDGFLNGSAGKERTETKGRFSKGDKKTTYTAHEKGALPRDVIKIPALAGGAGMNERVDHPTQKPLVLCDKLLRSCKQAPTEGYVLVPFAGSGSECVAAKNLGLPFVGIELNDKYVKLINERLQATQQTE
jgi:site-specific DNA-methyltransferase (adenine-specific)